MVWVPSRSYSYAEGRINFIINLQLQALSSSIIQSEVFIKVYINVNNYFFILNNQFKLVCRWRVHNALCYTWLSEVSPDYVHHLPSFHDSYWTGARDFNPHGSSAAIRR